MDLVFNGLWNTSLYTLHSRPLEIANTVRHKIQATPFELVGYCCKNARRAVFKTARTSPATLINSIYEPLKVRQIESALRCLRIKVPAVENVWEKLNTTPEEWYNYVRSSFDPNTHQDVGLSPVELIQKYGYPVEVYRDIETEDGYLLEMYRIPHGKNNKSDGVKPVVFLVHGLFSSSADYVLTGPNRGLGYLLADLGYDVWLGNPRGTNYTKKHTKYNPDVDVDYWKFSFHEIGLYDLPAMINTIRCETKCETFSYIGTSQGTTAFFVLTSEKPEYNKYINVMVALAPAVYVENIFSPLVKLAIKVHGVFLPLAVKIGHVEFPPKPLTSAISYINKLCHNEGVFQDVMVHMLFMACGYSYDQLRREDLPVILSNLPHSASIYQIYHFAQNAVSGDFRKFDYGPGQNKKTYGTTEPPTYDLSKVSSPVALFYSNGDYLIQPQDVQRLESELPNCIGVHKIEDEKFNHMDFVYGADVVRVLYSHVFKILEKFVLKN